MEKKRFALIYRLLLTLYISRDHNFFTNISVASLTMESVKTAEVMLKGNASGKYIGMNANGELFVTTVSNNNNYENVICMYV